ncbi:Hypothetical_protein [Hexamita inflata]|uniref:Hypothetical_protein n=1 Tax=Hexamita inflata TaxID=28002 RepID=A0ABP1HQZ4_9EUKA
MSQFFNCKPHTSKWTCCEDFAHGSTDAQKFIFNIQNDWLQWTQIRCQLRIELLKLLSSLIFWSAKQKSGSSSQNGQHTQGNQQFISSSNKQTNLSRQVELVGSDEQKFEGFKILNNNVLNDVQTRPNNNPMSFRPTNHHTLCSPFTKFVTYHVNFLMGKFSKQFWLALFRVIDVAYVYLQNIKCKVILIPLQS